MEITASKSKISPGISLTDETFNPELTEGYHLSVQLSESGLAYTVLDIKRNKYLALKTFNWNASDLYSSCENAKKTIEKDEALKRTYKSASVSLVHNRSTLVPKGLFSEANKNEVLSFNHSLEKDEDAETDDLKTLEAKNVYAVPHCFRSFLKELKGNVKISHYSTPLIESVLMQNKNKPGKLVTVNVQPARLDVIISEGRKLIFYNSFAYRTSEDFIYYLLFACEQLKLNPENLELVIIGELERNSTIYSLFYKYIRNIKFGSRSESFEYSYKLNEVPTHYYHNLYNQYLCV